MPPGRRGIISCAFIESQRIRTCACTVCCCRKVSQLMADHVTAHVIQVCVCTVRIVQATNGFARYWHIDYSQFAFRGEPKHGLWQWTMPGASRPIWWCDLGDFEDVPGVSSGYASPSCLQCPVLADKKNVQSMYSSFCAMCLVAEWKPCGGS
eukprot:6211799-Pleurochrysis_carterae.AAC.5